MTKSMAMPQFKIMSGALKSFTRKDADGTPRRYLSCTASSSIKDMHEDEFTPDCVTRMADSAMSKNMTIFLNHQYKVPEDVFGSTTSSRSVVRMGVDGPVTDMDLEVMLNETNPRAVATYDAIESGVKLGVSIGALIKSWRARDPKDKWAEEGMIIDDVELLEASIVGIPANPRSWVQNAVKAIKTFSDATPEDEAQKELLEMLDHVDEEKSVDQMGPTADEDDTDEATKAGCPDCGGGKDSPKGSCDCDYHHHKDAEPVIEKEIATEPPVSDEAPQVEKAEEPATESDPDLDAGLASNDVALKSLDVLVRSYTDRIVTLEKKLSQVTKERDEAQQGLQIASEIIDKIASLPLGRKTSFQHQVSEFRTRLNGVYDDEFLKFLERTTE